MTRCRRLTQCRPRTNSTLTCCRLPWHQRRSRAAKSASWAAAPRRSRRGRRRSRPPAAAPHQRRLDEVVAHDLAAERRAARQLRQAAQLGERRGADDRVVAPVVALAPCPVAAARREQRAVERGPRTAACGRTRCGRARAWAAVWISPTSGLASIARDQPHDGARRSSGCRRRARSCSRRRRPSAVTQSAMLPVLRRRLRAGAGSRCAPSPLRSAAAAATLSSSASQTSGSVVSLRMSKVERAR